MESGALFRFREYWPYNGGVATDLLYHKLAPLLIAISGPGGEYPMHVNANGGLYIEKNGRDLENHWIDAMRGNGDVQCNVDLGCATMVAIKMALESYRQRRTMPSSRELEFEGNVAQAEGTGGGRRGQRRPEGSIKALGTVLDALETTYPALRGTIRDTGTRQRRPFLRFSACEEDLSHKPTDTTLPGPVTTGAEPFMIIGAMAGG